MTDVSLINLKSLSKVGVRLLDVIYNVYGAPRRIKGETKARITSLRRINDSDLPEEQKRQLTFWHYVKADEQRNVVSTVEKALPQLTEDAKPEDVKPDWYRHFFNRQCSVSDSDAGDLGTNLGRRSQSTRFLFKTYAFYSF